MNKANRVIEGMSRELKLAHFSTGHVTVGTITQVFDNQLKKFYVAKIRGVIVGSEGEYKHETSEAALKYGQEILSEWRAEFTAANTACSGRVDSSGSLELFPAEVSPSAKVTRQSTRG
jgi:hypothetical protein